MLLGPFENMPIQELSPISINLPLPKRAPFPTLTFVPHDLNILLTKNSLNRSHGKPITRTDECGSLFRMR